MSNVLSRCSYYSTIWKQFKISQNEINNINKLLEKNSLKNIVRNNNYDVYQLLVCTEKLNLKKDDFIFLLTENAKNKMLYRFIHNLYFQQNLYKKYYKECVEIFIEYMLKTQINLTDCISMFASSEESSYCIWNYQLFYQLINKMLKSIINKNIINKVKQNIINKLKEEEKSKTRKLKIRF